MSKFFKKIYKYTPLGWYTKGLKKLGWKSPDNLMENYLDESTDTEIALQIALGLAGASVTSGLFGSKSKSRSDKDSVKGYDEYDDGEYDPSMDEDVPGTSVKSTSTISKLLKSLGVSEDSGLLKLIMAGSALNSTNHLTGNQQEQNAYNTLEAQKARDWQEQMYNNYYSPAAQVRQYQEAGLNPMSLAGGQSVTGSTPGASAPTSGQGQNDVISALTDLLSFSLEQKRTDADIAYTKSKTIAQDIENRYQDRINQLDIEAKEINNSNSRIVGRILTADATVKEVMAVYYPEIVEGDLAEQRSRISLNDEETKQIHQDIEQAKERFPEEMKQLREMTAQIQAYTALLREQKDLTAEQKKKVAEEITNLAEERNRIIKQCNLLQKQYDCYNADHSTVTVIPSMVNDAKDQVIVKQPDGTLTTFEMYDGLLSAKKSVKDLDGNKVKRK